VISARAAFKELLQTDQLGGELGKAFDLAVREPILNSDILALDVPELT
jgi:hypothetical protein